MKPLPIGVPGELYIAGDGVARGYHKRPELTAERFVANPFGGGKLYRTGDLVRYLPNGTLEFISRLDDQIKLHGFRIELGEIETVLTQVPGVRECTVVLREDIPGDKRLVAYVVASGTQLTNISDIRTILLRHLPDYMVPTTWVELPALPLTPNGKIDRKALPVPDRSRSTKEYVSPKSDLEIKLAKIWAEVLHLDRVGVNDQIFELGADSLHVFQITARANQAGIKMSARQLLQHRTIAMVLAEIDKNGDAPAVPLIQAVSREKYRIKRSGN
jgi:acyl carrier protein